MEWPANPTPLDRESIQPFVKGVIHFYWPVFGRLFDTHQYTERYSPEGKIPQRPFLPVERVVVGFTSHSRHIYLEVQDSAGLMDFRLYSGELSIQTFDIWLCNDILYDLRRVYGAVQAREGLYSSSVGAPTAHEQAEAINVINMIRRWRLLNR